MVVASNYVHKQRNISIHQQKLQILVKYDLLIEMKHKPTFQILPIDGLATHFLKSVKSLYNHVGEVEIACSCFSHCSLLVMDDNE